MGFASYSDLVKVIDFKNLTDRERAHWKKRFEDRKRALEAAIKVIDQALKVLSKKPRKKAAKRSGRRKR